MGQEILQFCCNASQKVPELDYLRSLVNSLQHGCRASSPSLQSPFFAANEEGTKIFRYNINMSCGFRVSVWLGGLPPQAQDKSQVVVTAGFPRCMGGSGGASASSVHIQFNGSHIYQSTHVPAAASEAIEGCSCGKSRQTLVVLGDAGSLPGGSEVWKDLFQSVARVEDECGIYSSDCKRSVWLAQRQARGDATAAGAASWTPQNIVGGVENEYKGEYCCERSKVLAASRAAYSKRVCVALSRRCRWCTCCAARYRDGESSRVQGPGFDCSSKENAFSSAAFSVVFHSEAYGLLFFCRDKLGLASLLAVAPAESPGELSPSFVLATSAAELRSAGGTLGWHRKFKENVIEVPVDGVWVVDLWALADSYRCRNASATSAFMPLKVPPAHSAELQLSEASIPGLHNAICVPWERPSIIRTEHMWCTCENCALSRELFWDSMDSVDNIRHDMECALVGERELLESIFKPFKRFAGKDERPPSLGNSCDLQRTEGPPLITSSQVLASLYRQLFEAVSRSIPEALQRIQSGGGPAVSRSATEAENVFVGVLFSGGVDSTLLAGMVLRVLAAAMAAERSGAPSGCAPSHRALPQKVVVVELVSACFSAEAPDRLTALRSFQDLLCLLESLGVRYKRQCDGSSATDASHNSSFTLIGEWALELRLVAVDVSTTESAECRDQLLEVIYPKRSHMDFNIAAPLYFASRGTGYLVSPNFGRKEQWQLLLHESSLWKDLLIRPPPQPRCHNARRTKCESDEHTEDTTQLGCPVKPNQGPTICGKTAAEQKGGACRVCRRQAKSDCVHGTCKLCCSKLQAVAAQRASSDLQPQACPEIHVNGKGRIRLSDIDVAVHAVCPVHRRRRQNGAKKDAVADEDGKTDECSDEHPCREESHAPFKSLSVLPCGVPLATLESGRPFMAMQLPELHQWCSVDQRRLKCVDTKTGAYTLQSAILLMGSGADEIFGGYARHRTANRTKGWGALRQEQILDLKRLWFRNMGRDSRTLRAFRRWARLPFLDEHLLHFVCCFVPFDYIVQPSSEARTRVEEVMHRLLVKATNPAPYSCSGTLANSSATRREQENSEERLEICAVSLPDSPATELGNNTKMEVTSNNLSSGNKWLLRLCAAYCGLPFSSVAKKRAMQFGSRSAKVSNSECFTSNRKARGDASLDSGDDNFRS